MLLLTEAATTHMLGPAMAADAITSGLAGAGDLELVVRAIRPRRLGALLSRPVPLVSRWDVDLQPLRWHLVHGLLARREAEAVRRTGAVDVVVVNTHTLGLVLGDLPRQVPTVLEVDLTMDQLHRFAMWRRWMPWSRLALAPSRSLERRAFAAAHTVVAQSSWVADAVRERCPSAVIEVLNPGIDVERFRPAPRRPRARPRLLFVAARFGAKGGHDLLRALDGSLGEEVDLDVVTRDEVPAADGLTVHRLDPGDELVDLFQQADLFVLPTHADGNPWVVVEALACGVPVVSTPVGAIPEMVGPGGRLVPVQDVPALRAAVLGLVRQEDQRAALGRAARSHAAAHFDRRAQGAALAEVVRKAATDHAERARHR